MRMTSKRLTEEKGALIFAEKWELNVVYINKSNKFRAVVKIDQLRCMGAEGEAMIGEPADFNAFKHVTTVLADPKRRRVFLGSLPSEPEEEDYGSQAGSQQNVCPTFTA